MNYLLKYHHWKKLHEDAMAIQDPDKAGDVFADVLSSHRSVKEQPKGSNTGPEVSQYLKNAGVSPGNPWCMAFVYSMFDELSKKLGITNPLPKTAGVLNHWKKADSSIKIGIAEAKTNPSLVRPGQIFIMSRPGAGKGHTGIVISSDPKTGKFKSIEGNTNDQQSGEGDRVGINSRDLSQSSLLGFIDYFKGNRSAAFENSLSSALAKTQSSFIPEDPTKVTTPVKEDPSLLKIGSSGEEVKKVQTTLGITPTGTFDDATRDAVLQFQAKSKDSAGNPLKQDGIVGPMTRQALFGESTPSKKVNAKVGQHVVISIPENVEGTVPVFVLYPGIPVGGKMGKDYMPTLISAAVPEWYSKYAIVIPNQHTTSWLDVKAEYETALAQKNLRPKNLVIGIFSGSGNNNADITKYLPSIKPLALLLMDPTPGQNLTNSVNQLGSSSRIIMQYNPSNWGGANYYVGSHIEGLEKAVKGAGGILEKVNAGHMKIPGQILIQHKSEIETLVG